MSSTTVPQTFAMARQHEQAGRLIPAERLCLQILAEEPDHAEALQLAGSIARQSGRPDVALAHYFRLCKLRPVDAAAHLCLGEMCRALGRPEEALAAFLVAAGATPRDALAHQNVARALHDLGRLPEAIDAYARALALDAGLVRCQIDFGAALAQAGRLDPAIAAFQRATELDENSVEAWSHLGKALRLRGQLELAALACRRALALHPCHLEACLNLSMVLKESGALAEAAAVCRDALRWLPDSAEACNQLGAILAAQGEIDEAVAMYRQAVRFRRDFADAHGNLGCALEDRGEIAGAIAAFQRALQFQPGHCGAWSHLLQARLYDPDPAAATLARAEHAQWNHRFAAPHGAAGRAAFAHGRRPGRLLRIGYVSGDFRDHAAGRNVLPLFLHHDDSVFEITCYSSVLRADALTRQFQRRSRHWCSIAGLPDDAVAERIREDRIDILVDLGQHTPGNRLTLFARQPAPLQVSFAGYPASAGVSAIRHRFSDRWLEGVGLHPVAPVAGEQAIGGPSAMAATDPAGHETGNARQWARATALPSVPPIPSVLSRPALASPPSLVAESPCGHAERVYLLDSFWCYDPGKLDLPVNDLPAATRGHVTFGSLNPFCKIQDPVLKSWARILAAAPDSCLLLLAPAGIARQRTAEFLAREGVETSRIEFVAQLPRRASLETYRRIDIALDPFPYGGHSTSLDALWMGVPIVTLAGETAIARAGLSQLGNLGLTELAAATPEDYVSVAGQLAADRPRLAQLRATLRPRLEASVLMDGARFARQIEAAYREMWREWCE